MSTLAQKVADLEEAIAEAKRWAAEDAEADAALKEVLKERYLRARKEGSSQGDAELVAKAVCRTELERARLAENRFKVALKEIEARRAILSASQTYLRKQREKGVEVKL